MTWRVLFVLGTMASLATAAPVSIRVVAANLTSGRYQSYSPDNANHSNPEGAGARILKALKPDVVLIQEFNTTVPTRQWVNRTLGPQFHYMSEEGMQIPNGVISRFPIISSGAWDDPVLDNREFAWARLRIPEKRDLWVVSVHFHSKSESSRASQAGALVAHIRKNIPAGELLMIGGDLNTRGTLETCFKTLSGVVVIPARPPSDAFGNIATNEPRNRPYDWVLASQSLNRHAVPVLLAGSRFPNGLVFDSRVFTPLGKCPPVRKGDSAVPFMQHMAVVRDFRIP